MIHRFLYPALAAALAMPLPTQARSAADRLTTEQSVAPEPATMAQPAMAKSQTDGTVSYPAAFFSAFRPQTLLDMLARLPGFTLDVAATTVRGFGANAGNVLIDGRRPTVKTGGIEGSLSLIPASRVERIEVIRGSGSADALGRAIIANVVLQVQDTGTGSAVLELEKAPSLGGLGSRLEISHTRPVGDWELSASLMAHRDKDPDRGTYRRYDPDDVLLSAVDEKLDLIMRGGTLTAGARGEVGSGTLSLNGRLAKESEDWNQRLTPWFGPDAPSRASGRYRQWDSEVGADWTRRLADDWTAKLVGLGRFDTYNADDQASSANGGDAITFRSSMTELVSRAIVKRESDHWLSPEFGGEVAWNRLDHRFTDHISSFTEHTRVAETRADLFANTTVRLSSDLRLETGIGFEISRIAVTDDRDLARILRYWKPNATLVWDVGPDTQISTGIRRTVGQLDFDAFAADADVIDNRPITGNAELRPDVTTAWTTSIDHRFGEGGAVSLSLARENNEDALTLVPLTGGGQAIANFGAIKSWIVGGKLTLPFDGLIDGGRLTVEGAYVKATRPDPVTGAIRADSTQRHRLNVAWRHDLEDLDTAYGLSMSWRFPVHAWYVGEQQSASYTRYFTAYVETMLPSDIKATFTATGFAGNRELRTRRFYDPDRSGKLAMIEQRHRATGTFLNLTFSRQF